MVIKPLPTHIQLQLGPCPWQGPSIFFQTFCMTQNFMFLTTIRRPWLATHVLDVMHDLADCGWRTGKGQRAHYR